MLSYMRFNKVTKTVDLGLEVCWQFLAHRCEEVTPRRSKVIYINLVGNYLSLEMQLLTSLSHQHSVQAPMCELVPLAVATKLLACN